MMFMWLMLLMSVFWFVICVSCGSCCVCWLISDYWLMCILMVVIVCFLLCCLILMRMRIFCCLMVVCRKFLIVLLSRLIICCVLFSLNGCWCVFVCMNCSVWIMMVMWFFVFCFWKNWCICSVVSCIGWRC